MWIRRRRQCFRIGGLVSFLIILSLYIEAIIRSHYEFFNPPPAQFNYFLKTEEYSKLGHIVDTSSCRILNISAWDKSIIPLISNAPLAKDNLQCYLNKQWTYIDREQRLILNETALEEAGYSIGGISCCYRPILRGNQSLIKYDLEADRLITLTSDCKPMGKVTLLDPFEDQFIRVQCKSKYWPLFMDVVYRYFHAVPLLQLQDKANKTNANTKTNYQKTNRKIFKTILKPNVVIVGIDSMSRLSFHRNMKKTRELLEGLGAVEMFGYTKLGENTIPNAIAFSTGLAQQEFDKTCNYSRPFDECPFIWKDFKNSGYLTSLIEDVPYLATFNYYKVGFIHPPVDFYFRPFMLALHRYLHRKSYYMMDCVGRQTVEETLQNYIADVLHAASHKRKPAFIYSWSTNLAHLDLNGALSADDSYFEFLSNRIDLKNTIVFFMSDHGYRYGAIRQTFAGWYEDKLPNFWVYLPPQVKNRFPEWNKALQINSRRLSSPLDLYHTFKHILKAFEFTEEKGNGNSDKPKHGLPKPDELTKGKGQSLFTEIPEERKCFEAGISDNFCACVVPKRMEVNDTRLVKAAVKAVQEINAILEDKAKDKEQKTLCVTLTLEKVLAGGEMKDEGNKYGLTYIVAFVANPGEFLFEASVYFQLKKNKEMSPEPDEESYTLVGDVLRMNKINTDVDCVQNDYLEKLCYCKSNEG